MPVERINPVGLHPPIDNMYAHIAKATGTMYRIGGQVAIDEHGKNTAIGDMATQLHACYAQIDIALKSQELTWDDVVHLYTFVTDMDAYLAIEQEAARPYFGENPPASTLVQVTRLVDPEWLVEVQADAVGEAKSASGTG
jgi:3-hydroxyisobutyrate dehydrogenase